jgi:signal transduction histidine kinase
MEDDSNLPAVLAAAPPARHERLVAFAVIAISILTLVVVTPFARTPLAEIKPFIPAYQAALMINDLITAVLLLGQFARLRSRAMLVLGCGYLFNTLIIISHTLSFPGLFAPGSLLGSGPQTTAWLYTFWHGGFALFVLAYALLERQGYASSQVRMSSVQAILLSSVSVAVVVVAVTVLTTAGHDLLPVVMEGNNYAMLVTKAVSPTICAIIVLGIGLLWPRRYSSILNLWLIVVLSTWLCDVVLSAVVGSNRYDLGFYAGRLYGLLSASFLLIVLLFELNSLHAELFRSREALARKQRFEAIGQLTGGVAHDFNNLLTAAVGNIEMLEREPGLSVPGKTFAKAALRALDRGSRLTHQLLAFGRRQALRPQIIDVSQWLKEFEILLQQVTNKNIQLRNGTKESRLCILIDGAELESAVLNLVLNARDAMPAGGDLTITARSVWLDEGFLVDEDISPGSYVALSVSDTGIGMSEDARARAFEPFFTTKEVGAGTGLGLSQVHGFIKQSTGYVTMETAENVGTTITLYLPLVTCLQQ